MSPIFYKCLECWRNRSPMIRGRTNGKLVVYLDLWMQTNEYVCLSSSSLSLSMQISEIHVCANETHFFLKILPNLLHAFLSPAPARHFWRRSLLYTHCMHLFWRGTRDNQPLQPYVWQFALVSYFTCMKKILHISNKAPIVKLDINWVLGSFRLPAAMRRKYEHKHKH